MWTLSAADVAYLAALLTIVSIVRDFYVRRKKRRAEAESEPAEFNSIVLGNAKAAMELQSGVFETMRRELEARNLVIADLTKAGAQKDIDLRLAEQRNQNLLARIGEQNMEIQDLRGRLDGVL